MSSNRLRDRIAALHVEATAIGAALAQQAPQMEAEELFEVTGQLQGAGNAVEGAQLVAMAHAASHETRLTDRGPVEVHHGLGFVDAMAPCQVSLEAGIGQWTAGRKVSLAARAAQRFPRLLEKVVVGELTTATITKVVSVCDGLDPAACASVEAVLLDRLVGLDPARVTSVTRKVATRIAADQMRRATTKNTRDRFVEVSPGPDGTTHWYAQLPAGPSAAMWHAVMSHGETLAHDNPSLTVDQARADALVDLALTNVAVTAKVTLGIPVITGPDADTAKAAALAAANQPDAGTHRDTDAGTHTEPDVVPTGSAGAAEDTAQTSAANPAEPGRRPVGIAGAGLGPDFSVLAALNGCEVPGIGFIDADTVETLLAVVPTDIGRALLDARTGTLVESVSTAYRPPKAMTDFVATRDGTCRMWGCTRPAQACDTDHARPWPHGRTTPTNLGGLCRRHHRLKQRRRWTYQLEPDGTVTWTSPRGKRRTTYPEHTHWPPPEPVNANPRQRPQSEAAGEAATRVLAIVEPPPF